MNWSIGYLTFTYLNVINDNGEVDDDDESGSEDVFTLFSPYLFNNFLASDDN